MAKNRVVLMSFYNDSDNNPLQPSSVLRSNIATVIGPTPPGTGVIHAALLLRLVKFDITVTYHQASDFAYIDDRCAFFYPLAFN